MVRRTKVESLEDVPRSGYSLRPADGKSELEEALAFQLRARKIGGWKREVCWYPLRDWRSDFLWCEEKVIVEVEGGSWSGGRHVRGGGFEADARKYNEAAILGWAVLRFISRQVVKGEALEVIERMLASRRRAA